MVVPVLVPVVVVPVLVVVLIVDTVVVWTVGASVTIAAAVVNGDFVVIGDIVVILLCSQIKPVLSPVMPPKLAADVQVAMPTVPEDS